MSYAVSQALQQALFGVLTNDVTVSNLAGGNIFDALPSGTVPSLYVLLGAEKVTDRSSKTSRGARHEFSISVVSDASGFDGAKNLAAAVCDALIDAQPALSRGILVGLSFLKAQARRGKSPEKRRIDLIFRAFVEDN